MTSRLLYCALNVCDGEKHKTISGWEPGKRKRGMSDGNGFEIKGAAEASSAGPLVRYLSSNICRGIHKVKRDIIIEGASHFHKNK